MDWRDFPIDGLKPFFPATDETKLANVALRLDDGRSTSTKQTKRTFAELTKCSKAAAQLAHLPEVGESRHCILKGDFALYDFIPACMALAEAPVDELLVATLSLSKKNAQDLGELVRARKIKSFAILLSHYFAAQEREIYDQVCEACQAHGGKVCAMRTHAKVLLMAIGDRRLVVESSANLRSCHNIEQATVFNDPGLFAFHREWMSELILRGER